MRHGLHGAALLPLGPGQEQEPIQLRFLPGEADILHTNAKERVLLVQSCIGVAVVHPHRGGADLPFHAVHRAKAREDRLCGCAQLLCHRLCSQAAETLRPHDLQCRLYHFRFCELVLRSHHFHPFRSRRDLLLRKNPG